MTESRLRFVTDNDGHWYAIRADMQNAFARWVESCEDDAPSYSGFTFDEDRLNMHLSNYTFTDLKGDE
jgi:hypothetical protein